MECLLQAGRSARGLLPLLLSFALTSGLVLSFGLTAVSKKDNKSLPSNYRPNSLTSICCKVMEHAVLSHMAKHLSKNIIIIDQQHGFRQSFSCEAQLITTIHDWAKSINVGSQIDAILLDFSKAFDSVPHQRLLLKLDYYRIRENMLLWIKAFLSKLSLNLSP